MLKKISNLGSALNAQQQRQVIGGLILPGELAKSLTETTSDNTDQCSEELSEDC